MKILFITFSDINACSSSNIRNVSLVKGFLDLGHTVDIISYKSSNSAVLIDESFLPVISNCKVIEITANLSTEKVSAGLLSSDGNSIKRKVYKSLRKIYYSLETVDSLRKVASELDISHINLGHYDVMISSSNPYSVHILAERIKNYYFKDGIKWIQYWGDALYLDTLTRNPVMPFRVKKAELRLIGNSDKVVYTNAVVLKLQQKLFPECRQKMTYIETPYAFKIDADNEIEYTVGYFGSYSSNVRDITPLYRAMNSMDCKSIIVGNGDPILESTKNLTVLPRATVNEVSEYERKTKILVCVCNKMSRKGETGLIPGKIYHYGSTNKEVLVIGATPDVKQFLEKYERYTFVGNNEYEIVEMLKKLALQEKAEHTALLQTEPIYAAKHFLESVF